MEETDIKVVANEVIFTTEKLKPYNPLNRPKIYYKNFVLAILTYIILVICTVYICHFYKVKHLFIYAVLISLLYFLIIGKRAIIWLVHVYQNKAKDETRLKCLFEPSCSEYMILALQKYGLFKGLCKGINRLSRCHYPNGGVDLP